MFCKLANFNSEHSYYYVNSVLPLWLTTAQNSHC